MKPRGSGVLGGPWGEMLTAAFFFFGGLLQGVAWAEAPTLLPRFDKVFAREDQALFFEASLPLGHPLGQGVSVGSRGLRYEFHWKLLDGEGQVLRDHTETLPHPRSGWESVTIVEPYSPDYDSPLSIDLEIEVTRGPSLLARTRAQRTIRRIRDRTPPVTKSFGDEEDYPDFEVLSLTAPDGGKVTTTDQIRSRDGEVSSRSPFQAIRHDGSVLEGEEEDAPGRLVFEWKNLYDNLAPPFTKPSAWGVRTFAFYLKPQWDLGASHPMVSSPDASYLPTEGRRVRTEGREDRIHILDLSDQLEAPPARAGVYGSGRVEIPLPYDRVGELEVGFYLEDYAWPSVNSIQAGIHRFTIEDDIPPIAVLSLASSQRGSFKTLDSVHRIWTDGGRAFELPEAFAQEPLEEPPALALRVRKPYPLHLMVFENTRINSEGARLRLEGPPSARGFGFRQGSRSGGSQRVEVPVDGFDASLARTRRSEPLQMYFSQEGDYVLEVEAEDVHRNGMRFRIPLRVEEQIQEWMLMGQGQARIRGGK